MNLQIIKKTGVKYDPVFLQIITDIPGGITVKTDRFPSTTKEIKKGTLLNDAGSGLWNVIKTVRLTADADSNVTILQVEPTDHLFIVGEYIHLYGGTSSTITRISSTAIAVESALTHTDTPSGTVLEEVSAAAASLVKFDTDAILRDTIEVRKGGVATLLDNIFAAAVVRGTVDESELPYFVTTQSKTDLTDRIIWA